MKRIKSRQFNKLRKRMFCFVLLALSISLLGMGAEAANKKAWVKKSGKTYYYDAKGKKSKGLKKIKGSYYYFDKKGVLYKKGWKTVKKNKYYFAKKNGAASTGVVKIGKKKYLFSDKAKLCKTGIQKYKKRYYYTKKGIIQTGLKTVQGKVYYFTSKGYAKTGWHTDKGNRYYFGTNGAALTGKQRIGGETYQFSSKGVLQKKQTPTPNVPDKKPDPDPVPPETEEAVKPERPVEPEIQDPNVEVPTVSPVANNKANMDAAHTKLQQAIQSVAYVESMNPKDWEPEGYESFQAVLNEAKAMLDATGSVIEEDQKWTLVYDPAKGTFVNKQREFDPENYPYTATELFQEAEKLKAYQEQCLHLQVKQVLQYYPEQSRAIFDLINKYRESKGLNHLLWSDQASTVSKLEAGYAAYIYQGTDAEEDMENLRMHHMAQCSVAQVPGLISAKVAVQKWIDSPIWHEPWLSDPTGVYGAVAVYGYNSANTGATWSKVIYTVWSNEDAEIYTHAPASLWPTLLNCETNHTVNP